MAEDGIMRVRANYPFPNHSDIRGIEMTAKILTQEKLKELMSYDTHTGAFKWEISRGSAKKGRIADSTSTCLSGKTYINIMIDGKSYRAHRLAWLYTTGEFPINEIDHIDGNGLNNRFGNLEQATDESNAKNNRMYSSNKSGVTGVREKNNKWISYINNNGRQYSLGCFMSKNDAIIARKMAEIKYNYHSNHGSTRPL